MKFDVNSILNCRVMYADHVGYECYGTIVAFELSPFITEDGAIYYLYIMSDDASANIHCDEVIGFGNVGYADIVRSDEVIIDTNDNADQIKIIDGQFYNNDYDE